MHFVPLPRSLHTYGSIYQKMVSLIADYAELSRHRHPWNPFSTVSGQFLVTVITQHVGNIEIAQFRNERRLRGLLQQCNQQLRWPSSRYNQSHGTRSLEGIPPGNEFSRHRRFFLELLNSEVP